MIQEAKSFKIKYMFYGIFLITASYELQIYLAITKKCCSINM